MKCHFYIMDKLCDCLFKTSYDNSSDLIFVLVCFLVANKCEVKNKTRAKYTMINFKIITLGIK